MRVFIIFLFFFSSVQITSSQDTNTLSGRILEVTSGAPVSDASVILKETSLGASTNEVGEFIIGSVPEGEYILEVGHMGYNSRSIKLKVPSAKTSEIVIALFPSVRELEEIVVEDQWLKTSTLSTMPYIETIYNRGEINRAAIHDVGEFLRSSKNINGIRKGGTQIDPVVRGFKYSQLNVLLNSSQKIEGGCPNRMDPATAHVETEDIEAVEILKGPYALRYGPSFGGVINMKTEKHWRADSSFVHAYGLKAWESNWNGNKEYLAVTAGSPRGFVTLSGGRKEYGNYEDGEGREVPSSFKKYSYKAHLGVVPFKEHLLSFSYEKSAGADVRFPALPMDERKDDTQLLFAHYTIDNAPGVFEFFNLSAYHSDVRHEMDNKYRPFSDTVVAVSVIDAINQGLRFETGISMKYGTLITGVDFEHITKDGLRTKHMILQNPMAVKKEKLWNNARITNTGVFAEYNYLYMKMKFVAAVRVDINRASSDSLFIARKPGEVLYTHDADSTKSTYRNLSVSVGGTRNISKKWSVSVALGRGVRSPDMTERFIILLPIGYDKYDYLGNPALLPETNNQVDLTFQFMDKKIGQFQLNGFYSLVENYITGKRIPETVQQPLSANVLGVKQFYNADLARLRGFEFGYALPQQGHLGLSVFAAWTYGTIDEGRQYVVNSAGEVVDDLLLQDDALAEIPPFESTVTVSYSFLNERLVPRLSLRMVAPQRHVSKVFYENETPGFLLAGFTMTYRANHFISLTGGIKNMLDVAYFEHLNRNIIGSKRNLYEPGRSFFINLEINI